MEPTFDWLRFQRLFYPQRRQIISTGSPTSSVFIVKEGDVILSAFAENEDLTDWVGNSYQSVTEKEKFRDWVVYERAQLDEWLTEVVRPGNLTPHLYEQTEWLREKAQVTERYQKHFLVSALLGWWRRVLPSTFGVYVQVEGTGYPILFMVIRQGRFELVHSPDLSTLAEDRRKNHAEVVRALSERYMVPVQGLFVNATDWAQWASNAHPWREVLQAFRTRRAHWVPFRWNVAALVSLRAYFGI